MSNEHLTQLVLNCQEGNKDSMAQLLDLFGHMIFGVIRNLLYPSTEIEDIYQEACIHIFCHINQLREPARFGGWAKRIAIGKAVDFLRKRSTAPPSYNLNIEFADDSDPAEEVLNNQETLFVQNAVIELPIYYKEVVILYYWSDCSYAEIAEALDIPMGTVMSRLHKAKQLLTEKLRTLQDKESELCGYRD